MTEPGRQIRIGNAHIARAETLSRQRCRGWRHSRTRTSNSFRRNREPKAPAATRSREKRIGGRHDRRSALAGRIEGARESAGPSRPPVYSRPWRTRLVRSGVGAESWHPFWQNAGMIGKGVLPFALFFVTLSSAMAATLTTAEQALVQQVDRRNAEGLALL